MRIDQHAATRTLGASGSLTRTGTPSLIDWLKHAFAIERKFSPTAEELALAERLCREIVRRELALPALAFLEMSRPLNSLGAQALHYFTPVLSAIFDASQCTRMAEFLDRRGSIDWLCQRLEELTRT